MLDTVFHLASGFSVQVYSGQQFSLNGACVDEADVLKLRKGFMDFFKRQFHRKRMKSPTVTTMKPWLRLEVYVIEE